MNIIKTDIDGVLILSLASSVTLMVTSSRVSLNESLMRKLLKFLVTRYTSGKIMRI